jgi:hypothetical protein
MKKLVLLLLLFITVFKQTTLFSQKIESDYRMNKYMEQQMRIEDNQIFFGTFIIISTVTYNIEKKSYKGYPLTYFSLSTSSFFLLRYLYLKNKQTKYIKKSKRFYDCPKW